MKWTSLATIAIWAHEAFSTSTISKISFALFLNKLQIPFTFQTFLRTFLRGLWGTDHFRRNPLLSRTCNFPRWCGDIESCACSRWEEDLSRQYSGVRSSWRKLSALSGEGPFCVEVSWVERWVIIYQTVLRELITMWGRGWELVLPHGDVLIHRVLRSSSLSQGPEMTTRFKDKSRIIRNLEYEIWSQLHKQVQRSPVSSEYIRMTSHKRNNLNMNIFKTVIRYCFVKTLYWHKNIFFLRDAEVNLIHETRPPPSSLTNMSKTRWILGSLISIAPFNVSRAVETYSQFLW